MHSHQPTIQRHEHHIRKGETQDNSKKSRTSHYFQYSIFTSTAECGEKVFLRFLQICTFF